MADNLAAAATKRLTSYMVNHAKSAHEARELISTYLNNKLKPKITPQENVARLQAKYSSLKPRLKKYQQEADEAFEGFTRAAVLRKISMNGQVFAFNVNSADNSVDVSKHVHNYMGTKIKLVGSNAADNINRCNESMQAVRCRLFNHVNAGYAEDACKSFSDNIEMNTKDNRIGKGLSVGTTIAGKVAGGLMNLI